MRWISPSLLMMVALAALGESPEARARSRAAGCPSDMVKVQSFCVDRFEMASADLRSGQLLSPFYPPHSRLVESVTLAWTMERRNVGERRAREMPLPELPELQRTRSDYVPRAVSLKGVIPQGYLSQPLAKLACQNAGKRLCTEQEWVTACRGQAARKFPYGDQFEPERCNVYRHTHPAFVLHAAAWYGHRDPRLNLVKESDERPLLRLTGATPDCASRWGNDRIYDMVGNIDEWIEDENGVFVGGFYARSTREGCEARIASHAVGYYDYSTGARCCRSLESS